MINNVKKKRKEGKNGFTKFLEDSHCNYTMKINICLYIEC